MSVSKQPPLGPEPAASDVGAVPLVGPQLEEPAEGPIPKSVLRRERRMVGGLFAAIVLFGLVGYLTIPTDDELVHTASTHPDPMTRVAAVNAMVERGYWADKAFKDFERFNKAGPYVIRQFLADMHGELLHPGRHMWTK